MIKIIHQGLGPIGRETAKLILKDKNLKIIGAIDPRYAGKDLGEVLGINNLGIKIADNAEKLFMEKPDAVVLATSSTLKEIMPSLETAIKHGINVVSPAEELFYPEFVDEEKAYYIDKLAKQNNARIIGKGVNPGCLMDSFPLKIFKENFDELISMKVYRWDNTIERRKPLLEKTGAGLSKEEFFELDKKGKIGHIGLRMSASFLADKIGLKNYKIEFSREPIIAKKRIKPKNGEEIKAGEVSGLHESCFIIINKNKKISLDLRMFVGAENKNSVEIVGIKNNKKHIKKVDYSNIVNGDIATIRILKEAIKYVVDGPAGLNKVDFVPDPNKLLKKKKKRIN